MRTAKVRKPLRLHIPREGKFLIKKINRASSHFSNGVEHYVSKKPYQAMGIILLAGVCVGFLIPHHH